MKRRDFLKRLGIGSIAVVAMPLVLAKEEEKLYSTDIKRSDGSNTKKMWETAEAQPSLTYTEHGWVIPKARRNGGNFGYPNPEVYKALIERYGDYSEVEFIKMISRT